MRLIDQLDYRVPEANRLHRLVYQAYARRIDDRPIHVMVLEPSTGG